MSDTAVTVVKTIASTSSLMMILSPSIAMWRVYKTKQVGVLSFIPLAALLANSHVWMMYSYLSGLVYPVATNFAIGDAAALVFMAVYWRHTTDRKRALRIFLGVSTGLFVLSLYVIFGALGFLGQSYEGVRTVMGFVADVTAVCLYGAPMERILLVLKHKSAIFFQIHMVIAGVINNTLWCAYGVLSHDWFFLAPNALFLSLGLTTLVLYVIFNPKTHPLREDFNEATVGTKPDDEMLIDVETTPAASNKPPSCLSSPTFEVFHSPLAPIHA